jgi:hypothetical protein
MKIELSPMPQAYTLKSVVHCTFLVCIYFSGTYLSENSENFNDKTNMVDNYDCSHRLNCYHRIRFKWQNSQLIMDKFQFVSLFDYKFSMYSSSYWQIFLFWKQIILMTVKYFRFRLGWTCLRKFRVIK